MIEVVEIMGRIFDDIGCIAEEAPLAHELFDEIQSAAGLEVGDIDDGPNVGIGIFLAGSEPLPHAIHQLAIARIPVGPSPIQFTQVQEQILGMHSLRRIENPLCISSGYRALPYTDVFDDVICKQIWRDPVFPAALEKHAASVRRRIRRLTS